jgi:hypothetical protein
MRASIPIVLATLSGSAVAQIQLQPAVNYQTPSSPDGIASADFDHDGHQDLAVAALSPDRIILLKGVGNGSFAAWQTVSLPSGSSPIFVRAADIDGDGDYDLIVVERDARKIQILINDGTGHFSVGPSFNTGNNPRWLITRPLRPGSAIDMAVLNRADGTLTVYLKTGNLQYSSTTYTVGGDPRCIAAADITGDTKPDLCITSYALGQVTILQNNGSGGFTVTGPLALTPGYKPNGIVAAQLTGGVNADIAVACADATGHGVVSVYRRLSNFGFEGPFDFPSGGLNPGQIAAADMDRDGKIDLIVVNPDSSNVAILRNTALLQYAAPVTMTVGSAPRVMTIADFNGDVTPDIAVTNLNSGTVSVLNSGSPPAPCYANCDNSTTPPILNVNDFQCFLNKYAAGNSTANCDNSTTPPILNVNDFQCFLNKFAAGCS